MDPTMLSLIYFISCLFYLVFFLAYIIIRHHFASLFPLHTAYIIGHPLTAHSILDTISFYLEFHRDEDVAFFGHG